MSVEVVKISLRVPYRSVQRYRGILRVTQKRRRRPFKALQHEIKYMGPVFYQHVIRFQNCIFALLYSLESSHVQKPANLKLIIKMKWNELKQLNGTVTFESHLRVPVKMSLATCCLVFLIISSLIELSLCCSVLIRVPLGLFMINLDWL